MTENNQTYIYHNDGLGTPQKMTDASGAVVWSAAYTSFGEATIDPSSTITSNLRFAGQYFDQETGINYNLFRVYDAKTGTYISKDPIGFTAGDTNLYRYVFNSPINFMDPLGLFNPTKAITALGNSANAGRLYSTGALRILGALGLAETGVGTPGSVVSLGWGLWNIRGATVAQNRGTILWEQAFKESWSDASWKNLLGVLPHGEKYDDPCEPSFIDYWWNYKIKNWWELISEIGTISP